MKNQRGNIADFHRRVLMDDMMETVGVNILDVIDVDGGQSYLRARSNCHSCASKAQCNGWLATHSEGDPQDFCPNGNFFRTILSGDR
ncbi:MAG: DUF6455 family protein [Hyphomicrobiales bacterium]